MSRAQFPKIKDEVHPSLRTKKLENVKNVCIQNNTRFKDGEFPPEFPSLVKREISKDYNGQWDQLGWARADQVFGPNNYDVFKEI